MTPDVISVNALPGYVIEAVFATGDVRRLNMGPYLEFPAFSALKESRLFMRAQVEHGVVVWNDEIDLSPDTLFARGAVVPGVLTPATLSETKTA
jgi:hypothetical protein